MGPCRWYVDVAHNELSIQAAGDSFSHALLGNTSKPTILMFNQQSILRNGEGLLRKLYNVLAKKGVHIDHAVFTTDLVWKDGTIIEGSVYINYAALTY
jgi:folylpolyglutamate synthase